MVNHKVKFFLVAQIVQLISQIEFVDTFTVPCNASVQTLKRVSECPTNRTSYEIAARKKNCLDSKELCGSFKYHCVLSEDLKYLVEVCAPRILIVGHVCAKFTSMHRGIWRIHGMDCHNNNSTDKCPWAYNSTDTYKYPQCYENVRSAQSVITQRPKQKKAVVGKSNDFQVKHQTAVDVERNAFQPKHETFLDHRPEDQAQKDRRIIVMVVVATPIAVTVLAIFITWWNHRS